MLCLRKTRIQPEQMQQSFPHYSKQQQEKHDSFRFIYFGVTFDECVAIKQLFHYSWLKTMQNTISTTYNKSNGSVSSKTRMKICFLCGLMLPLKLLHFPNGDTNHFLALEQLPAQTIQIKYTNQKIWHTLLQPSEWEKTNSRNAYLNNMLNNIGCTLYWALPNVSLCLLFLFFQRHRFCERIWKINGS